MARNTLRFPRELSELIQALDDHMVVLRAALLRSRKEPSFMKTVAAELRVLVCYVSGTEGLLWRVCERMQISDSVRVVDPGEIDLDHPLSRGLEFQVSPIRRPAEFESCETISLKEIIKSFRAIYVASIKDERISHEKLIRAVSEQIGGAHEDDGVSLEVDKLRSVLMNGSYLFNEVLSMDAELVLQVAERVIREAEKTINYQRHVSTEETGDLTIVSKTYHRRLLLGNLKLFTIGCELNELMVVFFGSPVGVKIQIEQYETQIEEICISLEELPTVASIALSYSSRLRQIRVLDGCKEVIRKPCDLGRLDTGFFSPPQFALKTDDFVGIEGVLLYQRLLSPAEVDQFKDISMSEFQQEMHNPRSVVDFPD